ncbi:hypothetical protein SALBM311S_03008 [Streptomyces alboniger]
MAYRVLGSLSAGIDGLSARLSAGFRAFRQTDSSALCAQGGNSGNGPPETDGGRCTGGARTHGAPVADGATSPRDAARRRHGVRKAIGASAWCTCPAQVKVLSLLMNTCHVRVVT